MNTPNSSFDQTNKPPSLELIKLVGSPAENFYQLGVKDRDGHKMLFEHMEKILKIPGDRVKKVLKRVGEISAASMLQLDPEFKHLLDSYCQGLGMDENEYLFSLLLPEFASTLGKWLPGLPTNIGCSSYFGLNNKQEPIHMRILDFSLFPTYEIHERAIQYDFLNYPTVFTYSTAGMPFPALHAMSSEGFSLALHQKFTPTLEVQGTPIFTIIHNILFNCHDEKSILRYLSETTSLTTWGINILFKSGKVLEIDIAGDQLHTKECNLKANSWHYINNRPLEHQPDKTFPVGIENYCDMRYKSAEKKLTLLNKKEHTNNSILKIAGQSKLQSLKNSANWNIDTSTMSSLGSILFSPKAQESLYNLGPAPKFYNGHFDHFKNCTGKISQTKKELSATTDSLQLGYRRLMLSQKHFDFKEIPECYHEIQMSIELLKGHPEELIARFFFIIYQYIFDSSKYSRYNQRDTLICLHSKLPSYLSDHAKIFINKIEKELQLTATFTADDIINKRLQKVITFDNKLPFTMLHKLISFSIVPRIDILDIIYAYIKI